jgi:hypothetical protein
MTNEFSSVHVCINKSICMYQVFLEIFHHCGANNTNKNNSPDEKSIHC